MKRVLIVSPVFNEADIISEFVEAISSLKNSLAERVELRLLLVDDGSVDRTLEVLKKLSATHDWVQYISFTANFGYQAAMVAGLSNAGTWPDAIITMDSDLEHPVELVPTLISQWLDNKYIVVNTIRRENTDVGFKKRFLSKTFYKAAAKLTGLELAPGQADFRLWDARILRALHSYLPHIGSLRVFAAWLPGKKGVIEYDQKVRTGRITRFTFKKNWELAAISIIRFSNLPLRTITFLGMLGVTISAVYALFIFAKLLQGYSFPGWTSIILTVIFMSCLQLVSIGILASYLRRLVFSKDLPLYIIDEARGLND